MKRLKGEKTQNGLKIMQSCTLNPVRRVRGFCESLPFARASVQGGLKHQKPILFDEGMNANMLDLVFVVVAQLIKTQTVEVGVNQAR